VRSASSLRVLLFDLINPLKYILERSPKLNESIEDPFRYEV
jgi:hypothetical protein